MRARVIYAVLLAVLVFLGGSSFAQGASGDAPGDAAPGPVLTAEHRLVLDKLLAYHGLNTVLLPSLTDALGLTRSGDTLGVRQMNIVLDSGERHVFNRLDDGRMILAYVKGNVFNSYLVTSQVQLIAAVRETVPDQKVSALPFAEAEKELAAELAYWAEIADNCRLREVC